MADWKRMYTDVSRMLDKYQNDVVPNLRKQLENRVEVVRCKDCKHYLPHPKSERKCCYVHITTPHFMPEDGFCSYGERRDDG